MAMTAPQRTLSFLQLTSRMKSPQLLLATLAISSSWRSCVPLVESFSIRSQQKQRTAVGPSVLHRSVHLPPRNSRPILASSLSDGDASETSGSYQSVTGLIYEMNDAPAVKLFTKEGCTLCDKVKDVSFCVLMPKHNISRHIQGNFPIFNISLCFLLRCLNLCEKISHTHSMQLI